MTPEQVIGLLVVGAIGCILAGLVLRWRVALSESEVRTMNTRSEKGWPQAAARRSRRRS